MKNITKKLILLAGVCLFICSCKEDELQTYGEESNIYFPNQVYYGGHWDATVNIKVDDETRYASPAIGYNKKDKAQDTLNYTMANGEIVVIPVRVMGPLADHDRDFACRVVAKNEEGVAVEGTNFRILDSYIPAKSRNGGIIVELISDGMDDEDVLTIEFELLPNENFQTNFYTMPISSGKDEYVSTVHITLQYTMLLLPPKAWVTFFQPALGTWSIKKISVLATYFEFDISDDFLYSDPAPNTALLLGFGVSLRKWLDDYKKEHGQPYFEKDNVTEMRAGDLIYSLY